ncbi:MAG: FecR domain-containing protein [Gammaproteobacteria bacterium]
MNRTTHRAPLNRQTAAEASEWFVRFRFDDIDAAARERFGEWLRRSPEHIQAYLEIAGTWAELPTGDPAGQIDVAALIARARAGDADVVRIGDAVGRRAIVGAPRAEKRRISQPSRRGLLAASIVLFTAAVCVAGWLGLNRDPGYATDVGEQRSITLADGSSMDLNSRTQVKIHFSKGERNVELVDGQALFRVAKDASRPFIVHSADTRVRAVGTQFDVYRKKNVTVVTVIEGHVTVGSGSGAEGFATRTQNSPGAAASMRESSPSNARAHDAFDPREAGFSGELALAAGEQALVTAQAAVKSNQPDVVAATAWTQKKLVFDATPLSEVASEFNRYNRRMLVVSDAGLQKLGISGVYSSTDPASLLRFLRDQPGIRILESEKEIRIVRAASP